MSEYMIQMKCKDFDSYHQFINRLAKIGDEYVIKNNCFISTSRKPDITGRHIVRDPLFDEQLLSVVVQDGVYKLENFSKLNEIFKDIKDNKQELRKSIRFYRTDKELEFAFCGYVVPFGKLLIGDEADLNIMKTVRGISSYEDLIHPVDMMENNEWKKIEDSVLINLRNGELVSIKNVIDGRIYTVRIAKSLFVLAGVSRMGSPLALSSKYAFLPSDRSDISIFRLHTLYKCGQSDNIKIDCVHDYLTLVYEDYE